jgi:hypothetical protein
MVEAAMTERDGTDTVIDVMDDPQRVVFDTATMVEAPAANLYRYLSNVVEMMNDCPQYLVSIEKLTLALGRWFDVPDVPRPATVVKGPNKYCFANARRLALRRKKTFRYVEGYGLSNIGFPCHHAWVIDAADTVIETTWEQPGRAYLGVVVDHAELRGWPAGSSVLESRAYVLHDAIRERRQVWG